MNVNDTVDKYILEFPHGSKITPHLIMKHCSGLWCYLQNLSSPFGKVMDQYHTPEQLMGYMLDRPLDFEPGSQYKYSDSGFILLDIIIERVTGITFGDFIKTIL